MKADFPIGLSSMNSGMLILLDLPIGISSNAFEDEPTFRGLSSWFSTGTFELDVAGSGSFAASSFFFLAGGFLVGGFGGGAPS